MKKTNKEFLEIERMAHQYRPVTIRRNDFLEVELPLSQKDIARQARRCMNCGIPFCHGAGCPLSNRIPDFNEAVVRGNMRAAWQILSETSPFPEFTSRVCPALCEGSCTAGLDFGAVSIRQIEKYIVETAWSNGWVTEPVLHDRTGRRIAVIGSGPAGLTAAKVLNQQGHDVTVYERNTKPGGLLRYGIPDFKLPKSVIDRRLDLLEQAGIQFVCDTEIGKDIGGEYLARRYDAVIVATGTPVARDLDLPGRNLSGIHFALEFLTGQNRVHSGERTKSPVSARGKKVLVIGGGDTGSDCVGTSLRQGAESVTQIEIMPQPPRDRSASTPWPAWPWQLRTSSSHEEGCLRRWNLSSLEYLGQNGQVSGVRVAPVEWACSPEGRPVSFQATTGREEIIDCDLVLLAMGFLKEDRTTILKRYSLPDEERIILTGDAATGPSLVVRAIAKTIGLKCPNTAKPVTR